MYRLRRKPHFDVVMLSCPLFCLLQFVESGVNMFHRLYSVAAPLTTGVLKFTFAVRNACSARSTSAGLSFWNGLENRVADGLIIITENSNRVAIFIVSSPFAPHSEMLRWRRTRSRMLLRPAATFAIMS